MTPDTIVVGGGLFGQIIAKALAAEGHSVTILDAGLEGAGSKPAACLMKPSWFSSLGKEVYDPALFLLDDLYGVQNVDFELRPKLGTATVHWIPPRKILRPNLITHATVTGVGVRRVDYVGANGEVINAEPDLVVVAAGIWTQLLLSQCEQQAQKGVAFLLPNKRIDQPFIRPWAPYKQLVAFNRGDGLWVGDGTAIKAANWTEEREVKSRSRCIESLRLDEGHYGEEPEIQAIVGNRPYAKGHKPCLLEEVSSGLWVASGGAKNGTLAAGWAASEIVRRTS